MQLQQRIDLLVQLGNYMKENKEAWQNTKERAFAKNGWFIPDFLELATANIVEQFLQKEKLETFANKYFISNQTSNKVVGIVMAGNIPLVGFHDFLCGFLSGHKTLIKLSEKDDVLLPHLVEYLIKQDAAVANQIQFATMLKNCDAYIATGSNNSARYFEQYFGKYPNIIRKNRTSVAILNGDETAEELALLADDVFLYFGLGCRNVTKLYVPQEYDFVPLLTAFRKYDFFKDHNKYKNNYDYNLAIHILNKAYYMTNESILLIENENYFSPISQLNYSFYTNESAIESIEKDEAIQCLVGINNLPFGAAQQPNIKQYADGVDTMEFLTKL